MLIIRKAQVARPDPVVKHIRMRIQILINYSKNQKMKDKDAECRRVFQSFKNGKEGKKALRYVVTKVSEFQSAKVFIKANKALSKKSFIILESLFLSALRAKIVSGKYNSPQIKMPSGPFYQLTAQPKPISAFHGVFVHDHNIFKKTVYDRFNRMQLFQVCFRDSSGLADQS